MSALLKQRELAKLAARREVANRAPKPEAARLTEPAWDGLLDSIEARRVIPIIGQDLSTVSHNGGVVPLRRFLAETLTEFLGVKDADLPDGDELNAVTHRYLAGGGNLSNAYRTLWMIAKDVGDSISPSLLQLAEIRELDLFVSTTFDSFMTRALNHIRFDGREEAQVFAYSPRNTQDLPDTFDHVERTTVYHLFGKLSAAPLYAVTHNDMLEFVSLLHASSNGNASRICWAVQAAVGMIGDRVQYSRKPWRCQARTVSGLTMTRAVRQAVHDCDSHVPEPAVRFSEAQPSRP